MKDDRSSAAPVSRSPGSTLGGQTGGVAYGGGESELSSQHFGQQATSSGYGMQTPSPARGWDSESGFDDANARGHEWAHQGVQADVSGDDEIDADFRRWREEKIADLERAYRLWRKSRTPRPASEFAGIAEFESWRESRKAARGQDSARGDLPAGEATDDAPPTGTAPQGL